MFTWLPTLLEDVNRVIATLPTSSTFVTGALSAMARRGAMCQPAAAQRATYSIVAYVR